jgi:hypothetical protein
MRKEIIDRTSDFGRQTSDFSRQTSDFGRTRSGIGRGPGADARRLFSDFWVEIEERFQAGLQLLLDVFLAAFEDVHRDVRLVSILELECCVADFDDFIRRQQSHAVNQGQVCHELDSKLNPNVGVAWGKPLPNIATPVAAKCYS